MSSAAGQPSTSTKSLARHIHPVIELVNSYKHFGLSKKWHQAMRNVNLLAYSGEVYVLLGPHGSGKTTILNVILGVYNLNQGFVKVFGFSPGAKLSGIPGFRVGYTPQSHGLFEQMTLNETFRYYGSMLKLESKYINERISYVTELLALPLGKTTISHCSEAEKRQVSFAIAILHEPELLLLDEPCQGVDPILRNSIWEHLILLVNKGVTIFLTTQNLQEACKADRLGILRNGYLLMEGSPAELIKNHKEKDLETLYTNIYSLKIRKNNLQEKSSIHESPLIKVEKLKTTGSEGFIYVDDNTKKQEQSKSVSVSQKPKFHCARLKRYLKLLPHWKRLNKIMLRDALITFRCFTWLIIVLCAPIILITMCSYTVGATPKNLSMGVVNFEANQNECETRSNNYISCQVLGYINKDIVKISYYDYYEDAERDAFKLTISAVLIVGEKFTNELMRTMANIALENVRLGNPNTAQLILRLDMTSKIIANAIEHAVKTAIEKYLKTATANSKLKNATIGYPILVDKPIFGHKDSADTEFICTGLIVTFLYHLAAYLTSMNLSHYKTWNLAIRDYLAGVRIIESILSQMVIYGLLLFIEAVLMCAVLILIRDLPIKGSLPYLTIVIFVQIWCGLCFGFLVASITKTSVQAGYVVFCFLCGSLVLCGVLWPLNGQPEWLLTIVKLLPQTQAIFAVRCIMQRGISINNEEVYLGIVIPLVWIILFILVTYLLTK